MTDWKKFAFLVVTAIICVCLVWFSIMWGWSEANEPYVATTQSADTPKQDYQCSVSVYPESPINILTPVEITINWDLPNPDTALITAESNWSWSDWNTSFPSFPQVYERTFLELGTYSYTYTITSLEYWTVKCATTIEVTEE